METRVTCLQDFSICVRKILMSEDGCKVIFRFLDVNRLDHNNFQLKEAPVMEFNFSFTQKDIIKMSKNDFLEVILMYRFQTFNGITWNQFDYVMAMLSTGFDPVSIDSLSNKDVKLIVKKI